jgi:hypothetical protein
VIAESNEDLAPVGVVEKIRVEGMEVGWTFDVALYSTFPSENLTCPDSRAEGACVLVMTVGSDMRGFTDPSSSVITAVREFGVSGAACTSFNLWRMRRREPTYATEAYRTGSPFLWEPLNRVQETLTSCPMKDQRTGERRKDHIACQTPAILA